MKTSEKLEAAKKRVDEIKGFYYHLIVYILVNLALLIFKGRIVLFFLDAGEPKAEGFMDWVDLNILLTPLLWGIAVFIHYFIVFGMKPKFVKEWEQRKLEQFLEEDEDPTQRWT